MLAPLRLTTLFAPALAASHGSVVMVNSALLHLASSLADYGLTPEQVAARF